MCEYHWTLVLRFVTNLLCRTERNIATYNAIPKWMADNGYKQPQDNKNLPFNLGKNTDLHFFEWLSQRPRHQQAFNEYMSFQRVGQKSWLDVFPLEKYVHGSTTEITTELSSWTSVADTDTRLGRC